MVHSVFLRMALEEDEPETLHGEGAGRILGERYQIREVLGREGMGEVYRAFDLKLRVDVTLKSVRPELLSSEKARELLRQEVRSAREVVSPNVCRIFDLVVEEGRELVSMEYIDGATLAETPVLHWLCAQSNAQGKATRFTGSALFSLGLRVHPRGVPGGVAESQSRRARLPHGEADAAGEAGRRFQLRLSKRD